MSSPDLLLSEYNNILTANTTEVIKQSQKNLLQFEKDPAFLTHNIAILNEPQVTSPVKKLVAIYLNKYSQRIVKEKSVVKSLHIIQLLLGLLSSAQLDIDLKPHIVIALDTVVSCDFNKNSRIKLNQQLILLLNDSMNQPDNAVNFAYLVFSGQALFGNRSYSQEIKDLIRDCFSSYVSLAIRLNKLAVTITCQQRDNYIMILKLVHQYSKLIKAFMKRLALLDIETTKLLFLPQFQLLIASAIDLNPKENSLSSSLFINIDSQKQISKVYNKIKSNYLSILISFVRLLHSFVKHPALLSTNNLYMKLPVIIEYAITSTSALLQIAPYYELPLNIALLQVLDQVLNFLVSTLRINDFYSVFFNHKSDLLQKIILPCLSLTPNDIEDFYYNQDQFVAHTLQIVERDIRTPTMQAMGQQEDEQIKQYQTLKTFSAEFLSSLCKFQDGTLTHIFEYAFNVIEGKIASKFPKYLMLLVISILRIHLKERRDLRLRVSELVIKLMESTPIPVVKEDARRQEDIQYSYLILLLTKLILFVKEKNETIITKSFKLAVTVIQSPSINQAQRYFILELFDQLTRIEEGEQYAYDIIAIFNHLLQTSEILSLKLLDSYFTLLKYNQEVFVPNPTLLIQGLQLICLHIQKQVKKKEPTQLLINKCWNIIREVGQGRQLIPALIPQIQEAVLPLLPYIDGQRNLDYEQDILLLLTSFIQKGGRVTLNQQKMFQIIPKIFYNQYMCRFGHAFHTIQIFIYFGSDILCQSFNAIQAIIEMSISSLSLTQYRKKPLNEAQNTDGVLLLQSLILKCWSVLTLQQWTAIIKAAAGRLDIQVNFNLLSSNLYGLLGLILVYANKFFSDEENDVILTRILSNMKVFDKVQYSPKVIIYVLSQLLLLPDRPFVGRRYGQILDIAVTMLQINASKKDSLFIDKVEKEEEKEYGNCLIMLKNDIKGLDQFSLFKEYLLKAKVAFSQLINSSVQDFPKSKKDFLIKILSTERVMNQPRQIFKIKR